MTFKQFDVVVIPFPFTDRMTNKKRPVLILSDASNFNALVGKSVMAMITTASHYTWALDVPINDLASAGLKTASIIRMKLFTLDDALVIKKIGCLAAKDILALEKSLQQLFRF